MSVKSLAHSRYALAMIAAVFPGQGSQKPGMGQSLFESNIAAREVFVAVEEATGLDIQEICFRSDEGTLRRTENAQMALYTCGVAAFMAWQSAGNSAAVFAGHSVGEYSALAASGTISIAEGAKLVQLRGQVMAAAGDANPGTMAAVLGLDRDTIQAVLDNQDGVVVVANDNCPGQLVISGEVAAVQSASEALKAAGAKRVLPLSVSGAFHSPLMEAPAEAMTSALAGAAFNQGRPVYSNVLAHAVGSPDRWPELLRQQLKSSVRWTESVQQMRLDGVQEFIEFGSGEVLCGLIKRIDASAISRSIDTAEKLV